MSQNSRAPQQNLGAYAPGPLGKSNLGIASLATRLLPDYTMYLNQCSHLDKGIASLATRRLPNYTCIQIDAHTFTLC